MNVPSARSDFNKLLFRREWPHFYAFDLLAVNGLDLRDQTLLERKRRLVAVLPKIESRILYLDHLVERGVDFYELACRRDLEGIIAKWAHGTFQRDGRTTSWLKIKHREYTQTRDRRELFEGVTPRVRIVGRQRDTRRHSGSGLLGDLRVEQLPLECRHHGFVRSLERHLERVRADRLPATMEPTSRGRRTRGGGCGYD